MNHEHQHGKDRGARNLLLATLLNVLITLAEIIGGLLSNSLALLSDALHNLSDTLAVLLAYAARRIGRRRSNERKTFGYKRIEILSAFFNAMVLFGISVFLVAESIRRFAEPEPIKGLLMFIVATAGLIFNLLAVILLRKHSHGNLNIRSAYLHLLGDTFSSVAVILGGIMIYFWQLYWVDPLVTILISFYIIKESYPVLHGTPEDINIKEVVADLENIDGIANIHHVHVWSLSDKQYHFECHADLSIDVAVSETGGLLSSMEKILKEKYGVGHLTVQFEYRNCRDGSPVNTF